MLQRLPSAGPVIFTIPGITDVTVNATTVGPVVRFTWPKSYAISGMWLSTRTPTLTTIANTKIRIVDAYSQEVISDGRGQIFDCSALALIGRQFRWFAFRRIVHDGDRWQFRITNDNGDAIIPWLGFRVEEIVRTPPVPRVKRMMVTL